MLKRNPKKIAASAAIVATLFQAGMPVMAANTPTQYTTGEHYMVRWRDKANGDTQYLYRANGSKKFPYSVNIDYANSTLTVPNKTGVNKLAGVLSSLMYAYSEDDSNLGLTVDKINSVKTTDAKKTQSLTGNMQLTTGHVYEVSLHATVSGLKNGYYYTGYSEKQGMHAKDKLSTKTDNGGASKITNGKTGFNFTVKVYCTNVSQSTAPQFTSTDTKKVVSGIVNEGDPISVRKMTSYEQAIAAAKKLYTVDSKTAISTSDKDLADQMKTQVEAEGGKTGTKRVHWPSGFFTVKFSYKNQAGKTNDIIVGFTNGDDDDAVFKYKGKQVGALELTVTVVQAAGGEDHDSVADAMNTEIGKDLKVYDSNDAYATRIDDNEVSIDTEDVDSTAPGEYTASYWAVGDNQNVATLPIKIKVIPSSGWNLKASNGTTVTAYKLADKGSKAIGTGVLHTYKKIWISKDGKGEPAIVTANGVKYVQVSTKSQADAAKSGVYVKYSNLVSVTPAKAPAKKTDNGKTAPAKNTAKKSTTKKKTVKLSAADKKAIAKIKTNNKKVVAESNKYVKSFVKTGKTTVKKIMHAAYLYEKTSGGKLIAQTSNKYAGKLYGQTKPLLKQTVTINGKKYYQGFANIVYTPTKYKDEKGKRVYKYTFDKNHRVYIKASNLDGITRNAVKAGHYINDKGHVIKTVFNKGTSFRCYGSALKKGKYTVYRVGVGKYVRASDLGVKIKTVVNK